MNTADLHSGSAFTGLLLPSRWQGRGAVCLLMACLGLPTATNGQLTLSDNFNDENDAGWTHYAPLQSPPWNETVTWTFPTNAAGGFGYRIFGGVPDVPKDPVQGNDTGPARVGSFRNDSTYGDFFAGVDLVNWDDSIVANLGIIAFRVNTPGFLTTFGYLAGYSGMLETDDRQASFIFVEFQTELTVTEFFLQFKGGLGLVSRLDPARKYRMVATATGANLRSAIYDVTDLLEPIAKIGVANADVPNGTIGIASINYNIDADRPADFTFDNYHTTPDPDTAVGFPGTPQVVGLTPAPQTLFYQPVASSNVTFNVTTFNTNPINTNELRLVLNGVPVPSSQLALIEVRTPITGSPDTNFFVRYTGTLASNAIYQGQIRVVDMAGTGTTNNWTFDTFGTNGTLLVEAEDYNYSNGQFQDDPPVSGLDPGGVQVNGGGIGYYDQTGTRDVDYFDADTTLDLDEQQYRTMDGVGTFQNLYVGDTPRPDHVATNVPDYAVWRMQAGEWLNYTRTFPAGNWNVYLRTSSQLRQAVRFDEVTSDRALPNQTKVLRGKFEVPNTGSSTRFRYVPLTDAVGNPRALSLSGTNTLRLTALGDIGEDRGGLQPTYFLFLPATNPPSQLPWIAFTAPLAGATNVSALPTVQITVLNGTTAINTNSIVLRFDGTNVTSSATISGTTSEGPGATITYAPVPPGFLQPNSTHTVSLVFADNAGTPNVQSNQWSFTVASVPVIPASFALLSGPGTDFNVQVHKAPNTGDPDSFPYSSSRAERQLANQLFDPDSGATPVVYTNEAANTPTNYGFYTEPNAINYEQAGISSGFFGGDTRFPGVPQNLSTYGDDPNHMAMAATIKLQLGAGLHRMGVASDDGFKVTAGTNSPPTDLLLGIFEGGRGHSETVFDFVVTSSGVYDFRLLYYEDTVGASAEWYWVNRTTGARELVRPLALESATAITGPFSVESSALIDPGSKTITVARSGSARYYRLRSTTAYTINSINLSGNNVVLQYQ